MAVAEVLRRKPKERAVVKYHVTLTVERSEDQDTVDSVRSRMGLLNSAMARVLQGSDDYAVIRADYLEGCLELDVWTRRLSGIREGVVTIGVKRVEASLSPVPRLA